MASNTPNTIVLSTNDDVTRPLREYKVKAGVTITPGQLCSIDTTNGTLQLHGVAGGNAQAIFAVENPFSLLHNTKAINATYGPGEEARTSLFQPGDEVYAWVTTSQTIAIGEPLESAGNGYLREHVPATTVGTSAPSYTKAIVAIALEAVTTTGTAARIKVVIA